MPEQLEAAFLERGVDARGPLHLAPPAHELDVVLFEAVNAVAARPPWPPGRRCRRRRAPRPRRHCRPMIGTTPMLAPRRKVALLPGELEIAHRLAQRLGRAHRLIQRAALEQDAELIAAQARERIAPAYLGLQQRAHLPEQGIAGAVAAGVVDDLELIQVQVAQRVGGFARLGALQRPLHAVLELAPVHQAR